MDKALLDSITALVTQLGFPIAVAAYYIYKDNKQSGVIATTLAQLAATRDIEAKIFQDILSTLKSIVINETKRDEQITQILKEATETNVILKVK
jgi:hypothetical protein